MQTLTRTPEAPVLRKSCAALILAAAFVAAPTIASAEEYPPTPPPANPSLAGSAVTSVCDGNVPYITYEIALTDPDSQSTSNTATLILSDGTNTESIVLGDLVNGQLSGTILWPGASVDANGEPSGWPGWTKVGGQWVQTSGNFGWTRNLTSATIEVNPDLVVPLSYPDATPDCATAPPGVTTASVETPGLVSTGVSALTLPIGLGALGLVAVGGVVMLSRRYSRR
jgi:hypothetical protein